MNPIEEIEIDELELLERQLNDLNRDVLIFESGSDEPIKAKKAIEKEKARIREEANQKLLALNAEKIKIDEAMFDARRKLQDNKIKAEQLQRNVDQLRRQRIAEQKFEMLETRWNNVIQSSSWSQLIKDHQIVGAKRIATQKRLILADTMGLGKTLTAIASWDLIQGLTKEASKDNPLILEDL